MRTTIERIEAGKLLPTEHLTRLGLAPHRVLRVVLETVDDGEEIPITGMNAQGGAFDWLKDEPDIYTDADLIERNETFAR